MDYLIGYLSKFKNKSYHLSTISHFLKQLRENLIQIDKGDIISHKENMYHYKSIVQKLDALKIIYNEKYLFQVDSTIKHEQSNLNKKNLYHLTKAVSVVSKLSNSSINQNIEKFKKRFLLKYQDKKIPLLEALDPDFGIGYQTQGHGFNTSSLINDLFIFDEFTKTNLKWSKADDFLFSKLEHALNNGDTEIMINDQELELFSEDKTQFPDSFSTMFSIFKENGIEKIQLISSGGATAVQLIGRFCSTNSDIYSIAKYICNKEEKINDGKIIAELLHLPETRTGNIIFRPYLRNYEIEYLSQSSLKEKQKINVQDLFLTIKQNKLILWSKKLNIEIIPRLSNAHNFSKNSLPVYHFLCDLQTQGQTRSHKFKLTPLSGQFKYLPRVSYKNVILSPATWIFNSKECKEISSTEIQKSIETFKLPTKILLSEGENKLYFNLENSFHVKVFQKYIKNKTNVKVTESLITSQNSLVKNNKGGFANELIAFYYKKDHNSSIKVDSHLSLESYLPGSKWIYLKIYCGINQSDKVIIEDLVPYAEKLIKNKKLIKWFFIRYNDDFPHLRVRFLLSKKEYFENMISSILKSLNTSKNIINSISIDTYKPEYNRYGIDTISFSESLFHIDSLVISDVIKNEISGIDTSERWKKSFVIIDTLLDGFNYNLTEKLKLLELISKAFLNEFGSNKILRKQLNTKYRELDPNIDQLIELENFKKNSIIDKYMFIKSNYKEVSLVLKLEGIQKNNFVSSHIHMSLNRLFPSEPRLNEMAVYFLLAKYYKSKIAKS